MSVDKSVVDFPVLGLASNVLTEILSQRQDRVVSVNHRDNAGGWLIVTEHGKIFVLERHHPDDQHCSLVAVEVRMKK